MRFVGIIPARYASQRFPGKPLAILGGKTVIQRVYEQVGKVLDDVYVATDDALNITGFLDKSDCCRYISGGIYALKPVAIRTLERCMKEGQSRMRNFQRGLVDDGLRLKAWPMSKILDVDHASDIAKAEDFLK